MSNLILNIRAWYWHLQITREWRVHIIFNHFRWSFRDCSPWFEVYR